MILSITIHCAKSPSNGAIFNQDGTLKGEILGKFANSRTNNVELTKDGCL
jgi:hypothetical protein